MTRHRKVAIAVTLIVLLCIYVFFQFTPLGLAMRAAAPFVFGRLRREFGDRRHLVLTKYW